MANKKRTLFTTGEKGVNRVSVVRHPRSDKLYLEWWETADSGQSQRRSRSMGSATLSEAKGEAESLSTELRGRSRKVVPREITVGELFDRYERGVTPRKAKSTQGHDRRALRLLESCWGARRKVTELEALDWERYIDSRRMGVLHPAGSKGEAVRDRTIEQDLRLARAVFNWAVLHNLIPRVPMAACAIPTELNPIQPMALEEDYEAFLAVAVEVHPLCRLTLLLTHETGHRINAIRLLKWSDIDFSRRLINWRAETDKEKNAHEVCFTDVLWTELARHRGIGETWIFPSNKLEGRPLRREVFTRWFKDMRELSGVLKEPRTGWHCFRRKWVNERKDYPLVDIAAAGGWKSTQTLLKVYMKPDPETMKRVVNGRTPIRRTGTD